jgi:hypothetical protein
MGFDELRSLVIGSEVGDWNVVSLPPWSSFLPWESRQGMAQRTSALRLALS